MEISELLEVFEDESKIIDILNMLDRVGLSYLKIGQSAKTLSGGESQRIKLAKELSKTKLSQVVYMLDEPTTGLHEDDVQKIIDVLKELNDKGATIIIIEHNDDMIKACDYAIELGPKGGDEGGKVVRVGNIIN